MLKPLAIALSLTILAATGAAADQPARESTSLTAQIDGFASDGGLGTTRRGGFASEGGLGTTRRGS